MEELKLRDEFIKLGQAMKAAGIVSSGIDAKMLIQDGQVTVNGELETRSFTTVMFLNSKAKNLKL